MKTRGNNQKWLVAAANQWLVVVGVGIWREEGVIQFAISLKQFRLLRTWGSSLDNSYSDARYAWKKFQPDPTD